MLFIFTDFCNASMFYSIVMAHSKSHDDDDDDDDITNTGAPNVFRQFLGPGRLELSSAAFRPTLITGQTVYRNGL